MVSFVSLGRYFISDKKLPPWNDFYIVINLGKEANNFQSIHDSFLHKPGAKIRILLFSFYDKTSTEKWINVK